MILANHFDGGGGRKISMCLLLTYMLPATVWERMSYGGMISLVTGGASWWTSTQLEQLAKEKEGMGLNWGDHGIIRDGEMVKRRECMVQVQKYWQQYSAVFYGKNNISSGYKREM